MITITPTIRFAAYAHRAMLETAQARHTASYPAQVEAFPKSYPAPLVTRAQALLIRMADAVDDRTLWTDLVAFRADVEASR